MSLLLTMPLSVTFDPEDIVKISISSCIFDILSKVFVQGLDKQQTDAEKSQGCVYEKQFSRDIDAQIIGQ